MPLDIGHAGQSFRVAAIYQAADSAHKLGCHPRGTKLIDLGLDVEKLDTLKRAVDQAGNAVQKTEARNVLVQEKKCGRAGHFQEAAAQPAPALRLRSVERWLNLLVVPFSIE